MSHWLPLSSRCQRLRHMNRHLNARHRRHVAMRAVVDHDGPVVKPDVGKAFAAQAMLAKVADQVTHAPGVVAGRAGDGFVFVQNADETHGDIQSGLLAGSRGGNGQRAQRTARVTHLLVMSREPSERFQVAYIENDWWFCAGGAEAVKRWDDDAIYKAFAATKGAGACSGAAVCFFATRRPLP